MDNIINKAKRKERLVRIMREYHMISYIIDLIFLSIIVLLFIICKNCKLSSEINTDIFSIVACVFPLVITIISIILQFRDKKTYGVSTQDFAKLRGFVYFNFIHIFCIFILVVFLYLLAILLSNYVLYIALCLIVLVYSSYFVSQEFTVLVMNEWYLKKIITNTYKFTRSLSISESSKVKPVLGNIIDYLILSEGLAPTYNLLKMKNVQYDSNVIIELIDRQGSLIKNILESIGMIEVGTKNEYNGIPLAKVIEQSYANISHLVSYKKEIIRIKQLNNLEIQQKLISIFNSLHKICQRLYYLQVIENKFTKQIIRRFYNLFYFDGNDKWNENDLNQLKNDTYPIIVRLCISNYKNYDLWFFRYLISFRSLSVEMFDSKRCDIGLFLSVFLYYVYKNGIITQENQREIVNLIENDYKENVNRLLSWKSSFARMITDYLLNPQDILSSLMKVYSLIHKSEFEFLLFNKKVHSIDNSKTPLLDKRFLINIYLEILIPCGKYTVDEIIKHLDRLKDKYGEELVYVINNYWVDSNGNLRSVSHTDFLEFYNIRYILHWMSRYEQKSIGKALLEFAKSL